VLIPGRRSTCFCRAIAGSVARARTIAAPKILNFTEIKAWLHDGRGLKSCETQLLSMTRFTLLTLVLLGPTVALAQHAGTPQEQRACSRDASHFCRNYLGDDMAVQQCLQQNRNRLSLSCRRVFEGRGM